MSAQALSLSNKKILVLGAGRSGIAAARFAQTFGAEVEIADDSNQPSILTRIETELGDIVKYLGDLSSLSLKGFDLLVLSPGVPREHAVVLDAIKRRILVVNELDLAASHLSNTRVVGITGTNGKSTTTTMLGAIFQEEDADSFVGGNLGMPLCEFLLDHNVPRFAAIELSSYQLETLSALRLDAALVTNLAPDHLDRYASVEDYFVAKANIFVLLKDGGTTVLNQKDPSSLRFLTPASGDKTLHFNGLDNNVEVVLEGTDAVFKSSRISLSSPFILGKHNQENAMAAIAAAFALDISPDVIQRGIKNFRGVPHRLEFIGTLQGVQWYNDSKATNVDAAITAINSFDKNVHLILGGLGKGASYAPLVDACAGKVKTIYTIGKESQLLFDTFSPHFEVLQCEHLENALNTAQNFTKDGDILLLSPACASLDQFESFAHRGELFRQVFQRLKVEGDATNSAYLS